MIRKLRLVTGLILFIYVILHLTNHVAGLWSLAAMDAMREVIHAIWHTLIGKIVLYSSILAHMGLAFYAIFRRRTLRMSVTDGFQLLLGLAIPFLLSMHVLGTRGAFELYGTETSYAYVLLAQWHASVSDGIQQVMVLLVAWIHGCVGIYAWLRLKPWFAALRQYAYTCAILLPVLSLIGVFGGAREVISRATEPGWIESISTGAAWPNGSQYFELMTVQRTMIGIFVGLLALTLISRWLRHFRAEKGPTFAIAYDSGKKISVPLGFTILEASRLGKVPHVSVCGGRGRCSTCRVRVREGMEKLPPPSPSERQVLKRVRAGLNVRLACQCRPQGDIQIVPLLQPAKAIQQFNTQPDYLQGQEMDVAILFVDIRAFTKISESKLPYDLVFLLNRYFEAMGRSIEDAGGQIDKFIGDAVMAIFGVNSSPRQGCHGAIIAAKQMGIRLSALNSALANDLDEPLRIGIGIHHGPAVIGEMGYGTVSSLTAIGDTVNTASRLEALTKEYKAQLVISETVLYTANLDFDLGERHEVLIRGRTEPLAIRVIDQVLELPRDL